MIAGAIGRWLKNLTSAKLFEGEEAASATAHHLIGSCHQHLMGRIVPSHNDSSGPRLQGQEPRAC